MKLADRSLLNELMDRVSAGDRSAIDPLFEKLRPIILSFANKLLASSMEAEDVTQQVLINIFSRSSEFIEGKDALSWVFGITAFECKTAKKKTSRRKENGDESLSELGSSDNFEDKLILDQLQVFLNEVIADLPELDRETILSSIENSLRPDIASATYRKRLQRAIARLKQAWSVKHEF